MMSGHSKPDEAASKPLAQQSTPDAGREASLVTCAYSKERRPVSEMIQIGEYWIAPDHKDDAVEFLKQGGEFKVHEQEQAPLPNFASVIQRGWSLFARNWRVLLAIDLCIHLPCELFVSYMEYFVLAADNAAQSLQVSTAVDGTIGIIGYAATFSVLSASWKGERPAFSRALGASFRCWGGMWVINLLTHLMTVVGLVLLLIPGIIVLVRTSFASIFYVDGSATAVGSLSRSSELSRENFWRIAGFGTFGLSCILLVYVPLSSGVEILPDGLHKWHLEGVVSWVSGLPGIWLSACFFVLYKALLAQKEADSARVRA